MAIQVRGLVKFPAQVVATGGISVTKANRVYTFTLDADLSGLSGLTTTGLVRRTGDGTFTAGNEVGASLSFSSGDVTIENGATNELWFKNATVGYKFDAPVLPLADGGTSLGTNSFKWSAVFIAPAGSVNFSAGDVLITHAAPNVIAFTGATNGYLFSDAIAPTVSDGAPLGSTSLPWSDLFMASGAVINLANGDVLVTHSSNLLSFTGAASGYKFDALVDLSSAAAGQISFPASQNASAGANVLDDYEEGTFTPVITAVTPGDLSVAYSVQIGSYTKIGNRVLYTIAITTSSFTWTTASGQILITGLPYTSLNTSNHNHTTTASQFGGITKANFTTFGGTVVANTTQLGMVASGSAQTTSTLNIADTPTAGTVVFRITGVYATAS